MVPYLYHSTTLAGPAGGIAIVHGAVIPRPAGAGEAGVERPDVHPSYQAGTIH